MKNHKEVSLRREVIKLILYGIVFSWVTYGLHPFLLETFARWTAPHTWQPSLDVAFSVNGPFIGSPMMISVIACLFSLLILRHYRNRGRWIASQVSLVTVMVVMFGTSLNTISEGRKILDSEILEVLAPLRIGMPRSAVEALVLRSNMRVADMHMPGMIQRESIEEFRGEMRQHWERAQGGETGMLVFNMITPKGLFSQRIHSNSIEEIRNAEVHVQRVYYELGAGTVYTLGLRFDSQDRLESAGYKREESSRGSAGHCEVILQRPATNPAPCDPTSNRKI
jgi:hypothetical protein